MNKNTHTKGFANNMNNTFTRRIWAHDPLYHTEVKLFIKDILKLNHVQHESEKESSESVFYYGKYNRPIQYVDIIGIIRAIDTIKQRVIKYCLDDGSATIECVMFVPPQYDSFIPEFNISELVRVVGIINEYRTREIKIHRMNKIEDPNEELYRWMDIIRLKKDVYCREYVVSSHTQGKRFLLDKPSTPSQVFWSHDDYVTTRTFATQPNVISNSASSSSSAVKALHNEKTLKRAIKEYIKINELNEFRFSRIIAVPELQQIAINILQSRGRNITKRESTNNKRYREEIRCLFKKILKSLVQDENYLQSDQNLISFKKKTIYQ